MSDDWTIKQVKLTSDAPCVSAVVHIPSDPVHPDPRVEKYFSGRWGSQDQKINFGLTLALQDLTEELKRFRGEEK